MKETERARSKLLVPRVEWVKTKSRGLNEIINHSVKIAASSDPFPYRRDPVLPADAYRDRSPMDAKAAIYPFKRIFQTAMVDENILSGFSTISYTLGQETEEPRNDVRD